MGAVKKNDIKPWLKKQWCLATIDSQFIALMEDLLDLYEKPYNCRYPVVGVDERPCQLLGDILLPLPVQPGSVKKEDYHYKRNGICTVFVAVEPLNGFRILWVRHRRTKRDYALFMELLARAYPEAEKICLVQDNLNTHKIGSFYETFPAQKARELVERFEFHYTPKKASWLNMAEIELSVLSKQCLDRRISSTKEMTKQVAAFEKKRNMMKATITWCFTTAKARGKMDTHYHNIRRNYN